MLPADNEGRVPMSAGEYSAFKCLMTSVSALNEDLPKLKDRAQLVPDTWRKLRIATSMATKALHEMFSTMPTKKLLSIQAEMSETRIVYVTTGPATIHQGITCVDAVTFVELLNLLVKRECWDCEKTHKASRKCPIKRAMEENIKFIPWAEDIDKAKSRECCELAGITELDMRA